VNFYKFFSKKFEGTAQKIFFWRYFHQVFWVLRTKIARVPRKLEIRTEWESSAHALVAMRKFVAVYPFARAIQMLKQNFKTSKMKNKVHSLIVRVELSTYVQNVISNDHWLVTK
jgi:glycopeptide antibiotics resistance protein